MKHKHHKRILPMALAAAMVVPAVPAFADDTISPLTSANPTGNVPVELSQASTRFSVSVPTVLPVDVDKDGDVTTANDNRIINHGFGPIEVKGVTLESQNGWQLQAFDTDFKTKKVGIKEYGFSLNDTAVSMDGSCAADFGVINGKSEQFFTYDANVATQKQTLTDEEIAQAVFTVGWEEYLHPTSLSHWKYDETEDSIILRAYIGPKLENTNIVIPVSYNNKQVIVGKSTYSGDYFHGPFIDYLSFGSQSNNHENKWLSSVVFEDGVQIEDDDASYMFWSCVNLKSVHNLPNSISTMYSTFSYSGLEKAPELPADVEDISHAFSWCRNLKQGPVKIPSKIKNMNACFIQCDNLNSKIEIPDGVEFMQQTFASCYSLEYPPNIPSTVISMAGVLNSCYSLTGILYIDANPTKEFHDALSYSATQNNASLILTGKSTMLKSILRNSRNYGTISIMS